MISRIVARIVLLGVAVAVAAPVAEPQTWNTWFQATTTTATPAAVTGTSTVDIGGDPPLKSGNPFSFPLPDGFPTLSPAALNKTQVRAHGVEPNGGVPTLGADDLTSIQLLAFNEIFEVAYFTELLYNVTNNIPGFTFQDQRERLILINELVAVQAQEALHADVQNKILVANRMDPIQPCQYRFPVSNLQDALSLASTFTDVVLGTLQDVQLKLASNGALGVVPIIGSVIGQEGEQNGFYRDRIGKIASAKPFLTRATREFAFSILNQVFVVPGSCPNSAGIKLPVFASLSANTVNIKAQDQMISYSMPIPQSGLPSSPLSLVLINGQAKPIVETIQHAQTTNNVLTFDAFFPFNDFVLDGLTVAAVTTSAGPFASAEDVAKVTIAGPGLIEIN